MSTISFKMPAAENQESLEFSVDAALLKAETGVDLSAPQERIQTLADRALVAPNEAQATQWAGNPMTAHEVFENKERKVQDLTAEVDKWKDNPVSSKIKRGLLLTAYITGIVAIAALTVSMMLVSLGVFGPVAAMTSFMLAIGGGVSLVALKEYMSKIGPKMPASQEALEAKVNAATVLRDESQKQARETVAKFREAIEELDAKIVAYGQEGLPEAFAKEAEAKIAQDTEYRDRLQQVVDWAVAAQIEEQPEAPVVQENIA